MLQTFFCFYSDPSLILVAQSAERTLDAPELLDDYYLNLLDWSCSG